MDKRIERVDDVRPFEPLFAFTIITASSRFVAPDTGRRHTGPAHHPSSRARFPTLRWDKVGPTQHGVVAGGVPRALIPAGSAFPTTVGMEPVDEHSGVV
jgi:hypothetical protein